MTTTTQGRRLPAEDIRKYFLDSPDPAELREADDLDRLAEWKTQRAREVTEAAGVRLARRRNILLGGGAVAGIFVVVLFATGSPWSAVFIGAFGGFLLRKAYNAGQLAWQSAMQGVESELKEAEAARASATGKRAAYAEEFERTEPKPTDRQMDEVFRADMRQIQARALRVLSLTSDDLFQPVYLRQHAGAGLPLPEDGERRPLVVYGPAYGDDYPVWAAVGSDRRKRYSRYAVLVICTTEYHLALYRCVLDVFTGGLDEERTEEYHYRDVVAVRSRTEPRKGRRIPIRYRRKDQQEMLAPANAEQIFEVVVSSGDRAQVITGLTRVRQYTHDDGEDTSAASAEQTVPDPDFQSIVDGVRLMLRDKKGTTGEM